MLFSLKGPIQTVCYVYVCDFTFCVSLVVHLRRLRVAVSEFEASRGGYFPQRPPSLCAMLQYTAFFFDYLLDLFMRAFLSYVFLFMFCSWHKVYNPFDRFWVALKRFTMNCWFMLQRPYRSRHCTATPFPSFPLFVSILLSATVHKTSHHGWVWDERLMEREGIRMSKLSTDFIQR